MVVLWFSTIKFVIFFFGYYHNNFDTKSINLCKEINARVIRGNTCMYIVLGLHYLGKTCFTIDYVIFSPQQYRVN